MADPEAEAPSNPLIIPEVAALNFREQRLVAAVMRGMSASDAMREAGYSEVTVRNGAKQVVERSRVQAAIQAAMAQAGISPRLLARQMRRGLGATSAYVVGPKDDKVLVEKPDHNTRHKYLETALRIGGYEPDKVSRTEEDSYEQRLLRIRGNRT